MSPIFKLFVVFACIFAVSVAINLRDVEKHFKKSYHGPPKSMKNFMTGTLRDTYFLTDDEMFLYDKGHNLLASLNGSEFININDMDFVTGNAEGTYFVLHRDPKGNLVLEDEQNWKFPLYEQDNHQFFINYGENKNATQINMANKIVDRINKVYSVFA